MDLSNPNNWALIFSTNLQARLAAQYGTGPGSVLIFDPIPSIQATLASPIGLVKATSRTAHPKWWLACWLHAYQNFANQKTRIYTKKCGLKTATLCQLPNYGAESIPYEIEFSIPHWMEDLNLELWQFTDVSGRYLPVEEQVILSAVEVVEERLRNRILNLEVVRDTSQ